MSKIRSLATALALAGALVSGGAAASHVHWHLGINVGPGWWYDPWPWYHSPFPYPALPYPYYVAPPAPTTYIERNSPAAPADNWWYYCPGSKTYYPYVKECAGGWQRVSPLPPDLKQ